MTENLPMAGVTPVKVDAVGLNAVGLSKNDYRGNPSTLCQGCGHNSISNQIISALYEMNISPDSVVKFSGIGCSSKSPTYFLNRSFGFNGLHGRMPSVATGGLFGDHTLRGIGVSGDGDTASIGMGQFKHAVRRNVNMVYIVENNGVYGLTKGQFSATAEVGLSLKKQGINQYMPIDICMEAIASNATFVARSFAGDPKQVKELLKAALAHNGIAVLDIISPCVTFNNNPLSNKSYDYGKANEIPLHEIELIPEGFVPEREEINIEDYEAGEIIAVEMHDGSFIRLKKVGPEHDPRSRAQAYDLLEKAEQEQLFLTGLIYYEEPRPTLGETLNLVETPLVHLPEVNLRPPKEALDKLMQRMM
jgi:2-oxoglutarate ferredoxin oxidoreductase subunit beta